MTKRVPSPPPDIKAALGAHPVHLRKGLLALRRLIFETAAATPGVGALEETLKWGQPAYLTPETKSGSTIRLGVPKEGTSFALYIHCQTRLAQMFRQHYPGLFTFEGNRALHFKPGEPLPEEELRHCIRMALTYKLKKGG